MRHLRRSKYFLFVITAGFYSWVVVETLALQNIGAREASSAYLLVAATCGCVALIPSSGNPPLRTTPAILGASSVYVGASLLDGTVDAASTLGRLIGPTRFIAAAAVSLATVAALNQAYRHYLGAVSRDLVDEAEQHYTDSDDGEGHREVDGGE